MPVGAIALTRKACLPKVSLCKVSGEWQGRQGRRPTLQRKVLPGTLEVKLKLGVRS